jgi:uncharacterized membrane protein YtjA (UPF0391 family)
MGARDDSGAASGTKACAPRHRTGPLMLRFAVIFLIISLIAGAFGLVNISDIARRISMILFAIFFLLAALLFGMVVLIGEAIVK